MDARAPRLVLEIDDRLFEFDPNQPPALQGGSEQDEELNSDVPRWLLGTCVDSDLSLDTLSDETLSVKTKGVSRIHAAIEFRNSEFFLVDESTNGTYIQTEDAQVRCVHRDQLRLWGTGWISLGAPLHTGLPIHFRQSAG